MPIVVVIIFALVLVWIGWPIGWLAKEAHLTGGQAFLVFLAGSLCIFVVSLAVSYVVTPEAVHYTPPPQPSPSPSGSNFTDDGLIRDHKVSGRRVAVYETHTIAGFKFLLAVVPWPGEKHRIYILKSPGYGDRSTDAHSTHRYYDRNFGCHYICVDRDYYPEELNEARNIGLMWSQATARYIKTGETFG